MSVPVLRISDLHLVAETQGSVTPILRGVNIAIDAAEICGLVGESGAGKTMVAKAVMGVLPHGARITAGQIDFCGEDLLALPDKARRALLGRKLSMILQNPMTALNPVLRIERQITDVLEKRLGYSRLSARATALDLLHQVRIRAPERVLRQFPHELSGGMCQRIGIAIAFAGKPALVVADEPTTALDVTVQLEVLRLIKELQQKVGTSVLFVTHDLGVVAKTCDSMSVMFGGRSLEAGSTERMFAAPHHPYTAALIAASPRHDQPQKGLQPIPSDVTDRLSREIARYDAEHPRA